MGDVRNILDYFPFCLGKERSPLLIDVTECGAEARLSVTDRNGITLSRAYSSLAEASGDAERVHQALTGKGGRGYEVSSLNIAKRDVQN